MTPAAERVLRFAMTLNDPDAMRELIRAVLEIPEEAPEPPKSRKAINQARYRSRQRSGNDPGHAGGHGVTENGNANGNGVAAGVTGALPRLARGDQIQDPPSFREDPEREEGDLTRAPARGVAGSVAESGTFVTGSVTAPAAGNARPTNVTADGCYGAAISAWVEGIKAVTRKPFTAPRGGSAELAKLVDAMAEHCPEIPKREAWARDQGRRFAETAKGRLSAHSFVDWLNSPPPDAAKPPPLPPSETPAAKAERRRRDQEFDEAARNAVPPPPELLSAIGVKPTSKGAA